MNILVKTKVDNVVYEINIDEKDEMDALHKAIVLGNVPSVCDECKEFDIKLDTNKDKEGNTYINAVCKSCGAKAKLGRYKTSGFFWHKFEKWIPKDTREKMGRGENVVTDADLDEADEALKDK